MSKARVIPARGRPRDPQRRRAILDAAMGLIAEVGYDRMTIDAIATRSGVSKPTLYRRWPHGKLELVADAIRERQAEAGPVPDTGSLRGDLLALVALQTGRLLDEAHLACGLAAQMRTSPELAAVMREHVIAEEHARVETILERARARGELARRPISPLFADVAGALVYTRVTITGEPVDDAFAAELVDRVLLPVLNIARQR
jgi:AcrR family transcriptional regulator